MDELLIRAAAAADIDWLEELEKECFSLPWTREQLISQLPDDMHVFLIAETGGIAAGYVGMMHVVDEGYISMSPSRRSTAAAALQTRSSPRSPRAVRRFRSHS